MLLTTAIAFLILSLAMWINYTIPYLEKQYNETMGVPNRKVGVMFIVDAIKAIDLSTTHDQRLPVGVQLHIIFAAISIVLFLSYAVTLDYNV